MAAMFNTITDIARVDVNPALTRKMEIEGELRPRFLPCRVALFVLSRERKTHQRRYIDPHLIFGPMPKGSALLFVAFRGPPGNLSRFRSL